MHRVSAHGIVVDSCCIDVLVVELAREKWIWQLAEELLQQPCHTIDVVLECFGIAKVHLRGI